MNSREKFIETMNFTKKVSPNKWEFGYWGATVKRWYRKGLPEKQYPKIPTKIINTTTSLYTAAWTSEWIKEKSYYERIFFESEKKIELPDGIEVIGGGLYWPTQGLPLDNDTKSYFNLDTSQMVIYAEQLVFPQFETKVLKEDENYIDYIDLDGYTRRFSKKNPVIPAGLRWPIKNWDDWNKIKEERMNLEHIKDRLPENWGELVKEYKSRD